MTSTENNTSLWGSGAFGSSTDDILAGLMSGLGWGDAMDMEEAREDAIYLGMSEKEFNEVKQIRKVKRHFKNWDDWLNWARRIEGKRRTAKNAKPILPQKEKEFVDVLIGLRRDYKEHPYFYFKNAEEQSKELYKLEADICKQPGGKWRMQMIYDEEAAAARPAIDALIARVKRGAVAVQAVKYMLASNKIVKFMKNVKKINDAEEEEWNMHRRYLYGCHCC
jgi:hypothetical protein